MRCRPRFSCLDSQQEEACAAARNTPALTRQGNARSPAKVILDSNAAGNVHGGRADAASMRVWHETDLAGQRHGNHRRGRRDACEDRQRVVLTCGRSCHTSAAWCKSLKLRVMIAHSDVHEMEMQLTLSIIEG
jgi:hypothetical protein